MKTLYLKIRSVIVYLLWVITGIFNTPLTIFFYLTTFFDSKMRLFHAFSIYYARSLAFWIPGWRLKVEGKENFEKGKSYVVIGNHQSMLDILLAFQTPYPIKWISKKELFKVPFIGWILFLGRHISIKRGNKNSAMKMTDDSLEALNNGFSIVVFPEGTRSNGNMLRFKDGAFRIAKKAEVDIIPFVIDGVLDALAKGDWFYKGKGKMKLRFLKPVPYEKFKDMEPSEAGEFFRTLIGEELKKFREEKS